MTEAMQTTIDGREVTIRESTHVVPLSDAQREILKHLRLRGTMRSYEAGIIMHSFQPDDDTGHGYEQYAHFVFTSGPKPSRQLGCCPYAAGAGSSAMKRLAARGLVRSTGRGRWELVPTPEEAS